MLVSGGKVRERQRQRAQQLRADAGACNAMQETGGLLHSPQSRAPRRVLQRHLLDRFSAGRAVDVRVVWMWSIAVRALLRYLSQRCL